MESLPNEVLEVIIRYIQNDRINPVSLVKSFRISKRFYIIGTKVLYKDMHFSLSDDDISMRQPYGLSTPRQVQQWLDRQSGFSYQTPKYDIIMQWPSASYSLVSSLTINFGKQTETIHIDAYHSVAAVLSRLEVEGNLRSFSWTNCEMSMVKACRLIFPKSLRSLELNFRDCEVFYFRTMLLIEPPSQCICQLLSSVFPGLENLRVTGACVCANILPKQPCNNLRTLFISSLHEYERPNSSEKCLEVAKALSNLLQEGFFPSLESMQLLTRKSRPSTPGMNDISSLFDIIASIDICDNTTTIIPVFYYTMTHNSTPICIDSAMWARVPTDCGFNIPKHCNYGDPDFIDLFTNEYTELIPILEKNGWMTTHVGHRFPRYYENNDWVSRYGWSIPMSTIRIQSTCLSQIRQVHRKLYGWEDDTRAGRPLLYPVCLDGISEIESMHRDQPDRERASEWDPPDSYIAGFYPLSQAGCHHNCQDH